MAITYLKKSPKTSSTDDTKTTGIVKDLLKDIEKTREQGCIDLTKKYSLNGLMTGSRVMCISEKVLSVFKNSGWKKLEVFQPGEELEKLRV